MMNYIPPNVDKPRKVYFTSEEERLFLDALMRKSSNLDGEYSLRRSSNGTINVDYNGHPIGKIKLQGKGTWMMVMVNVFDSKIIKGDLSNYIGGIDNWISYIENYLINEELAVQEVQHRFNI